MTKQNSSSIVPSDNPIEHSDQDVLDRSQSAISFAQNVLKLDASKGAVVGVFSPWGYGKTSFFHLARPAFDEAKVPVFNFNPWLFSNTEQLVDRFFAEFSAELGADKKLKKVGKAIKKYGNVLIDPTKNSNNLIVLLLRVIAIALLSPQSTSSLRKKAENELKQRSEPIVVVLDDVDRLSVSEIRDIFKLVRLTASFPNLIYIVLCDRVRVEKALGEQGLPGREYLQKIIQLPYDLPEVSRDKLGDQLKLEIDRVISCIDGVDQADPEVLPDVYNEIILPLICNMRDVRRYVAAVSETLPCLRGEVATADVLGLEAVRLFLPDVFQLIPSAIDILTVTSTSNSNERDFANVREKHNAQVVGIEMLNDERMTELLTAAKAQQAVAHALISHLFKKPQNYCREGYFDQADSNDAWVGKLLQDRRIAYEDILLRYLERIDNEALREFHDAQQAFNLLINSAEFEKFIKDLEPKRRMNVISRLYLLNYRFESKHMEPGMVGLLNLLPILTEESNVDFDTARANVERTTERLIFNFLHETTEENLDDASKCVIERIFFAVKQLSSKVVLVNQLKRSPEVEQFNIRWIPESVASDFGRILCEEIQSASDELPAKEHNSAIIREFQKSKCG